MRDSRVLSFEDGQKLLENSLANRIQVICAKKKAVHLQINGEDIWVETLHVRQKLTLLKLCEEKLRGSVIRNAS